MRRWAKDVAVVSDQRFLSTVRGDSLSASLPGSTTLDFMANLMLKSVGDSKAMESPV